MQVGFDRGVTGGKFEVTIMVKTLEGDLKKGIVLYGKEIEANKTACGLQQASREKGESLLLRLCCCCVCGWL
jgi:hypothetical protein